MAEKGDPSVSTDLVRPAGRPRHHPAVARDLARADDVQQHLADQVTRFAGSMSFVYLHVAVFVGWMVLLERSPWPSLTLAVSLEAIFLSTFVMIGQNRQGEFLRVKADHDFASQEEELRINTQHTRTVERLVSEIHRRVTADDSAPPIAGLGHAAAAAVTAKTKAASVGQRPGLDPWTA